MMDCLTTGPRGTGQTITLKPLKLWAETDWEMKPAGAGSDEAGGAFRQRLPVHSMWWGRKVLALLKQRLGSNCPHDWIENGSPRVLVGHTSEHACKGVFQKGLTEVSKNALNVGVTIYWAGVLK